MAFYVDESQIWKCPKHPSKRQKSGICPKCFRDRLITLCPNSATARPCACCSAPVDTSSSSSPSSSSFSLFLFSRGSNRHDFATSATTNVETDSALRRSRSSAIPFLRSRSKYVGSKTGGCEVVDNNKPDVEKVSRCKINFWSVFTLSKKCDEHAGGIDDGLNKCDNLNKVDDNSTMMRSRSVAVGAGNGFGLLSSKQKEWYYSSPINAFRHSKPHRSVAVA